MSRTRNLISHMLEEQIDEFIAEHHLQPHDRLPTERKMCEMWNCNIITLRRAIQRLANEGVLYSIQGSGTYVADRKVERNLWQFSSFSQAMRQSGATLGNRLISQSMVEANKVLARSLKVPLGEKIIVTSRLRIVNGTPFALENSYIPYRLCNGLEAHDLEQNSLFEILRVHYGIIPVRATQEIEIYYVEGQEAQLLDLPDGEAVLLLSDVAFDAQQNPIEYAQSLTRGDRCIFYSKLKVEGDQL